MPRVESRSSGGAPHSASAVYRSMRLQRIQGHLSTHVRATTRPAVHLRARSVASSRICASPLTAAMKTAWDPKQTAYPSVRRADTVETFKSATRGDVAVPDPYSWLHDPDSAETKQFVQDQGEFTRKYLDQYTDRKRFSEEVKKNWNYPRCQSRHPRSLQAVRGPSPPHIDSLAIFLQSRAPHSRETTDTTLPTIRVSRPYALVRVTQVFLRPPPAIN